MSASGSEQILKILETMDVPRLTKIITEAQEWFQKNQQVARDVLLDSPQLSFALYHIPEILQKKYQDIDAGILDAYGNPRSVSQSGNYQQHGYRSSQMQGQFYDFQSSSNYQSNFQQAQQSNFQPNQQQSYPPQSQQQPFIPPATQGYQPPISQQYPPNIYPPNQQYDGRHYPPEFSQYSQAYQYYPSQTDPNITQEEYNHLMSLTDDQISNMKPEEQEIIKQIRAYQYGGAQSHQMMPPNYQ